MSIVAINSVWEYSEQKGTGLLILQFIAKHENVDGVAFPGVPRIARYCKITETYVYRILKQLEKARDLYIRHGGGRRVKNLYLIPHGKSIEQIQSILTLKQYFNLDGVTAHLHAIWLKDGRGEQPVIEIPSQSKKSLSIRNGEPQYTVLNPEPQDTVSDRQRSVNPEPQEQYPEQAYTQTLNHSTPESVIKVSKVFKEEKEAPPAHSQNPQPPAPAPAPEPAPTDPIDQGPAICNLYRNNISISLGPIQHQYIESDIIDLDRAGYDPLEVFTYAITQTALNDIEKPFKYMLEIINNVLKSKKPLAAYISHRQAKTKRNGGPKNGHSANSSGARHNQADGDDPEGKRIERFLASLDATQPASVNP